MITRPIARISGLGVAVPSAVRTNEDWEKTLDTSNDWIVERTGIRERRWAGPDETVAGLSQAASEEAFTPQRIMAGPPRACTVRKAIPSLAAAAAAPATVLGMSWSLRSRKTSISARRISRTISGPAAVKSSRPTLTPPTRPATNRTSE